MDIILNDYSLDGKFDDLDSFIEWFNVEFKNILDYLIEKHYRLLKKSDLYLRKITAQKSLLEILNISGDPAITRIKLYIQKMAFREPYWDNELKTNLDIDYFCPMDNDIPNCFTEAIERDKVVISLKHEDFNCNIINYKRDGIDGTIYNINTYINFLIWLLGQKENSTKYIFENYRYQQNVYFPQINNRCYAAEAIDNNDLIIKDKIAILNNISNMIESMKKGEKTRFWDSIRNGIFEYRISVSNGREFRLLFFQSGGIYFLNGFIKKTNNTPIKEIELAEKLKQKIEKSL